jgi:hypothetical protein
MSVVFFVSIVFIAQATWLLALIAGRIGYSCRFWARRWIKATP